VLTASTIGEIIALSISRLHSAASQKTAICILVVVRTRNLTKDINVWEASKHRNQNYISRWYSETGLSERDINIRLEKIS
jgi:hypothetical protein